MLSKERKSEIISKFAKSGKDTGSVEIQIAVITERINEISAHLNKFPKDVHSRMGLVKLVGKRRRLNIYLEKNDKMSFDKVKELLK
ncbi:TPA: 30S ribosomal protein S15 [Candidatus Dependentiae bacterium]|nr:MAG: 30S ribosomal protein S15 [candidate division TM6 bacterium GW2011_GWE2_31_21]KKP54050.1 MAG: 30S ribosomal protein S15 [candidate division TM6 bacterium GW2011_GWF2_33_332]HBS48367.1 30S ribosomal protein S15 [Candidatus Dependentiae bacterium]HBZ72959.1 30S ribosomal protein S15 [Candidatus Dependentiae bacterium]